MKSTLIINSQINTLLDRMRRGTFDLIRNKEKYIFLSILLIILFFGQAGILLPEWLLACIALSGIGFYIWGLSKSLDIEKNLKKVRVINKSLEDEKKRIDNFEKIYKKIQIIYTVIVKFDKYMRLHPERFLIVPDRRFQGTRTELNIADDFRSLFRDEISFLQDILSDLRSDLAIRLAEQQKTLEQAKSEVEKLSKTPLPPLEGGLQNGLEQVSELQTARLDRQIEQFEELQRVLVKA